MPSYSHENKKHFRLNYENVEKIEKKRQPVRGFNPERGLTKRDMSNKLQEIIKKEDQKTISYDKTKYYFVISLTISVTSDRWKLIQQDISSRIIHMYDDKTIKIAINKIDYPTFSEKIIEYRKYVKSIQEISYDRIITKKLEKTMEQNGVTNVSIETVDLSGIKDPNSILKDLRKVIKPSELIDMGYHNNQKAILRGKLAPSSIDLIKENLETVFNIDNAPILELGDSSTESYFIGLEKYMITQDKTKDPYQLPIICIADSGVNIQHKLLNQFISETYSYLESNSDNCPDDTGHGTLVSSIAIYKNMMNKEPASSKVIMVKLFDNHQIIRGPVLSEEMDIINDVIQKFKSKTKIFNFSFGTTEENLIWTRTLNDIVYENDVILIVSAGNITKRAILSYINSKKNYPVYLFENNIHFPGDCENVITVGSYTKKHSDLCIQNQPSPFTRCGQKLEQLKPDVLEEGGNLRLIKDRSSNLAINLDHTGLGIIGASNIGSQTREDIGTSFSSPGVANIIAQILKNYPGSNPFLVKAILISSSNQLTLFPDFSNSNLVQGFGVPVEMIAVHSVYRRTCYLLQGAFEYSKPVYFHRYYFYFPRNANRLTITIVLGRPSDSTSFMKYRIIRGGSSSYYTQSKKAMNTIGGYYDVYTTHKRVIEVDHGGKGEWIIELIPYIKDVPAINNSIKYGCVLTAESTSNKDVYTEIEQHYIKQNTFKDEIANTIQPTSVMSQ